MYFIRLDNLYHRGFVYCYIIHYYVKIKRRGFKPRFCVNNTLEIDLLGLKWAKRQDHILHRILKINYEDM